MREVIAKGGKVLVVEHARELPRLSGEVLYEDCETTSGDDKVAALDAFAGHRIAGVSVTNDTADCAWYIPLRHGTLGSRNIDLDAYRRWQLDILKTHREWRNNNVKFDAHFVAHESEELARYLDDADFVDVTTGCKMIDSDRGFGRGTYELDDLAKDWLGIDMSDEVKAISKHLAACGSRDYGCIPIDVMSEYAGTDVLVTRELDRKVERELPEDGRYIWSIEKALTPVLYDVERRGLPVADQTTLRIAKVKAISEVLRISEKLHQVAGFPLRPHVTDDLHELLCVMWGMPVIARTDKGNPSFDAKALEMYSALPEMQDEPYRSTLTGILRAKELQTMLSLFIEPYMAMSSGGRVRPKYNQCVRTGRTSSSDPNAQQLSMDAKLLIICLAGRAFLCLDYSQIEYRAIAHFIRDERIIEAYLNDPLTDFHKKVAEMCGIKRSPAKNVNFGMGYGMGRDKTLEMLAANKDIIATVTAAKTVEEKRLLIRAKAESVYESYHQNMPTLKPTTKRADRICRQFGYSKTVHGRRRHLSEDMSWLAFSAACQGTAADITKERMVATSRRHWAFARENDVNQIAMVHDELVHDVPENFNDDPRNVLTMALAMEDLTEPLRVPMIASASFSKKNWYECKDDDNEAAKVRVDRTLDHYALPTWRPERRVS